MGLINNIIEFHILRKINNFKFYIMRYDFLMHFSSYTKVAQRFSNSKTIKVLIYETVFSVKEKYCNLNNIFSVRKMSHVHTYVVLKIDPLHKSLRFWFPSRKIWSQQRRQVVLIASLWFDLCSLRSSFLMHEHYQYFWKCIFSQQHLSNPTKTLEISIRYTNSSRLNVYSVKENDL